MDSISILIHKSTTSLWTREREGETTKQFFTNKMWQNLKLVMQSTAKCLLNPPAPSLPPNQQIQTIPTSTSPSPPCILKQSSRLSRRELAICTKSSLLILLGSQAHQQFHLSKARAEENPPIIDTNDAQEADNSNNTSTANNTTTTTTTTSSSSSGSSSDGCKDKITTKRVFFDISINGEPIGRIIIGLYGNNAPVATARFSDIICGAAGISYRRKEFVKIMPNYIQHGGVRSFGVDAELAKKTGSSLATDKLITELEKTNESCPGAKNVAGSVGIIVRDPLKPPPKVKLVARKGKLEVDEEEVGKDPNGTEFVISTKDSPELDASSLVVGRVLEGMEVVGKIGQVKTVQENTSSPYFRVAKLVGDKRAVVAERGFNRPYSKVIVTNCGLLE